MRRTILSGAVMALASLSLAAAPAMEWNVDVPHSGIDFSVKHFFTPVQGSFEEYEAVLLYDRENPEESSVRVRIDVASVNTANARRDEHLLSGDFFEAERHPHITFESREVEAVSETELRVRGPLTIKGVTREVELPVTLLGHMEVPADMQEMLGGVTEIVSFETALTLDRRDFEVGVGSWAATAVVGKEVDVRIAVEANR